MEIYNMLPRMRLIMMKSIKKGTSAVHVAHKYAIMNKVIKSIKVL